MIKINWLSEDKNYFEIYYFDYIYYKELIQTNQKNILSSCEAEYCPLNAKSIYRKLPWYLLWLDICDVVNFLPTLTPNFLNYIEPLNNKEMNICLDILFGGGLQTELIQIINYLKYTLPNKQIGDLFIRLIGAPHLAELMELNADKNVLMFDQTDDNINRARYFENMYNKWLYFNGKLSDTIRSTHFYSLKKFSLQIHKNIETTNKLPNCKHIIFTFDSVDDCGSSTYIYEQLKEKLSDNKTNDNTIALSICSNNHPLDTDIDILYSNKYFNIKLQNVNKKISLVAGGLIGGLVGGLAGWFLIKFYRK